MKPSCFLLLAFFFALFPSLATSCAGFYGHHAARRHFTASSLKNATYKYYDKRWLSVPQDRPLSTMRKGGAWPWPKVCNNEQIVRYCYKDKRTADNLDQRVMIPAIQKYAHAFQVSNLRIDLDPGCKGDPHVYCGSKGVANDALVVTDVTDDAKDWTRGVDCQTETSYGYRYGFEHGLDFCHLQPGSSEQKEIDIAIMAMMHELGHAVGLRHEHQRSDRDAYLHFNCHNLAEWEEAFYSADADEQHLFPAGTSDTDKINAVCSKEAPAGAYFPLVRAVYLKIDDPTEFKMSQTFDYDSIMIYSSTLTSVDENDDDKWVLTKTGTAGGEEGDPVWTGGSQNPADAKLSAGDLARIAQLYMKFTPEGMAAQSTVQWGQLQQVKVTVRGYETIVDPPRRNEL